MTQRDRNSADSIGYRVGGRDADVAGGAASNPLPVEHCLAAIVAHELSNPFTALAGRVDLMRNRKDIPAALVRDLEAMRSANERIERILSNLKAFSRRDSPPPRPVDVQPVMQAAVEQFRSGERGARLEVTIAPMSSGVRVEAEPGLLQTTIVSTLDALAGRSSQVRSIELRVVQNLADEEASLVFRDQGPALSEEEIERVFHPFGGHTLIPWSGAIILAYCYYIIRPWGGNYRFRREGADMVTELSLVLHP